jgi:hypothetical protein
LEAPIVRETSDASVTFVVRVRRHGPGRLSGIVERVRTGEKRAFQDDESIGVVIGQMVGTGAPQIEDAIEDMDES